MVACCETERHFYLGYFIEHISNIYKQQPTDHHFTKVFSLASKVVWALLGRRALVLYRIARGI
jgi:hypothetical protein